MLNAIAIRIAKYLSNGMLHFIPFMSCDPFPFTLSRWCLPTQFFFCINVIGMSTSGRTVMCVLRHVNSHTAIQPMECDNL